MVNVTAAELLEIRTQVLEGLALLIARSPWRWRKVRHAGLGSV